MAGHGAKESGKDREGGALPPRRGGVTGPAGMQRGVTGPAGMQQPLARGCSCCCFAAQMRSRALWVAHPRRIRCPSCCGRKRGRGAGSAGGACWGSGAERPRMTRPPWGRAGLQCRRPRAEGGGREEGAVITPEAWSFGQRRAPPLPASHSLTCEAQQHVVGTASRRLDGGQSSADALVLARLRPLLMMLASLIILLRSLCMQTSRGGTQRPATAWLATHRASTAAPVGIMLLAHRSCRLCDAAAPECATAGMGSRRHPNARPSPSAHAVGVRGQPLHACLCVQP